MFEAWIQGAYIHRAVRSALSQIVPVAVASGLGGVSAGKYKQVIEQYPSKPYESKEKMDEVSKEEKFRQDMLDWY